MFELIIAGIAIGVATMYATVVTVFLLYTRTQNKALVERLRKQEERIAGLTTSCSAKDREICRAGDIVALYKQRIADRESLIEQLYKAQDKLYSIYEDLSNKKNPDICTGLLVSRIYLEMAKQVSCVPYENTEQEDA